MLPRTVARNSLFASLPRFRRGSLTIFAVTVLATALLADQPLAQQLILTPDEVTSGAAVWQPLSASFVYPDGVAGLVLGTLIVQWFIGGQLEDFWGTRKYVTLVLASSVVGYLGSVLLSLAVPVVGSTPVGGAMPIDLAAIAAYGAVFGSRVMSLANVVSLKARTFAIIVGGLAILSALARGAPWPVIVPWLLAIVTALLVVTQPWRRAKSSGKLGGRKSQKRRAHLRVVGPDDKLLN